ncbi:MAG: hypothetical protein EBR94_08870 [Bacteroidetes bacterium]|nr:hypothetical protein [Bacteroidota bacterium]
MLELKFGLIRGEISKNIGSNQGSIESRCLRLGVNKKMAEKIHRNIGEHTTLFMEFCFCIDES